jgi:sugar phosphate isomerase/epimerase
VTFHLACQTITWGDGQAEHFDRIFAVVKAAGFDGVEIGYRRLSMVPPDRLRAMLGAHGLVLAASHVGGNLEDRAQAGGERSLLAQVLDYLAAAGCELLMYSGLQGDGPAAVADEIAMLGRAADLAAERGVRLLYHNHHWEFLRPGIMDALLAQAPASLGLCPDLGWLHRAGVDVLTFLQAQVHRLGALHLKDFATPGDGTVSFHIDTVPLGQGVAPLREVAAWTRSAPLTVDPFWVIAEQDRHDGPAEEAVALNGRFLCERWRVQ